MNKIKVILVSMILGISTAAFAQAPATKVHDVTTAKPVDASVPPSEAQTTEIERLTLENLALKANYASTQAQVANTNFEGERKKLFDYISVVETKYKAKFDQSSGKFFLVPTTKK